MLIPAYINVRRGDLAALSAALGIMARRARLLGLDAPVRTDNRSDVTMQNEDVLVVGSVMTPEAWAAAVKAQKEAITGPS